jgi:hypothetical protein
MTESPKLLISSSKELRKSHPETRSPKVIKGEKQNKNPKSYQNPPPNRKQGVMYERFQIEY